MNKYHNYYFMFFTVS